jgi:hypothetical protein
MAEIQFPNAFFAPGTLTAEVLDNNGDPRNVLDAGQDFTIRVRTDLSANAAAFLGGTFEYAAYVESIGPGPEQQVGNTETRANNGTNPILVDIVVPANTLPDNVPPGQSGAYLPVVLLTHRDNSGQVTDVAAVVDGPVLRIS